MSDAEEKATSKKSDVEPVEGEIPKERTVEEDKENLSDEEYTDGDLSEEEEESVQANTEDNELAELQTEAELPLDELRKRYHGSDENKPGEADGDVNTSNPAETDSSSTKKRKCESESCEEEVVPKKAAKVADAKSGQAEA